MNTFEKQLAGLPARAQGRFRHVWGDAPWNHPEYKQLHHRRVWKAELFAHTVSPRWW